MSHSGWLCLGGTEIVNQERVSTYAAAGWKPERWVIDKCNSCGPEIAYALEEPNGLYSNPGSDKAPWFSGSEPDSFDFGGLYVLAITGLGPGQFTRSSTQRASGLGAVFGPGVQASPLIVVTGLLLGRTCCAVEYGYRWLSNVLRGSCGADCDGDDLAFLDCCPEWCDDSPEFTSYADCMEPFLRTMKNVTLVAAPVITARYGGSCGCDGAAIMQVQFTLSAGQPCVFRPPTEVESGVAFNLDEVTPCPTWIPTDPGTPCLGTNCAEPADCLADPLCAPPAKPPVPPPPSNPCICNPFQTVSACIDLPSTAIPEFAEGVPIIEVSSGSDELRQVKMRFIPNPLGLPVDELDPCTACGEVTLSRIPPFSTFRMDGMERTVTILCPGDAVADATPLLGVADGRLPFRFPEIACSSAYTMCVEADSVTVAPDASISLSIAVREC